MLPTEAEQNKIMEIIFQVKAEKELRNPRKQMIKIAENQIKKVAQGIIAGCTEIPIILKNGDIDIPIIDPTLILAEKVVEKAKK
jgi:aspartate racemase